MKTNDELSLMTHSLHGPILEYMKKFGDSFFEICDECFEVDEILCKSDPVLEMEDHELDSSTVEGWSSDRRRQVW